MNIVDVGAGPPLVLIPGVQGRWEWMRPGVEALSRHYRVLTFSLGDEPASGYDFKVAEGFSNYVAQIEAVMDTAGVRTAIICGLSYGGLIAAAIAARHPDRTSALVLLSALPPRWQADSRARFYLRFPRLLFPLFALQSLRLTREIRAARDTLFDGLAMSVTHGWNVVSHPTSPVRMARRVRFLEQLDLEVELSRLNVQTLIVTGEDRLDHVVPPMRTREYLKLWPQATSLTLTRTGHLGLITRPDELISMLAKFLQPLAVPAAARRQVG